jgi:hypothetical protein
MAAWPTNEPQKIAKADDLRIAPFREDGVTYGTPTWIWSVQVDDSLYVRAYNVQKSRWYQAAVQQKAGMRCSSTEPSCTASSNDHYTDRNPTITDRRHFRAAGLGRVTVIGSRRG